MLTRASRTPAGGSIIALAGRRIDAPDANPARFPLASADAVRERIRATLAELRATALVSSAACGADLLALDAAGELGLRRIIVLPFDRGRFRDTSVIDRPGGEERWGRLFDRVMAELPEGDIITLNDAGAGTDAYLAANGRMLDRAGELARQLSADATAVIVWEGAPRGPDDLTAAFARTAREHGMPVHEISTR